jgi:hypothetical protein
MRFKWVKQGLLALAMCALAARGASAAVIFSDNFDGENSGFGQLNYTGFFNFTVAAGTVDLIGNGFADFLPGNGLYIDLDGSSFDSGVLAESPALALASGWYNLKFDLAGSQRSSLENVTIKVYGASNPNYNTQTVANIPGAQGFTQYVMPFFVGLGGDAGVQFSFENTTNLGDNVGGLLDRVILEDREGPPPSTPEPLTLSLLGTGVLGLVARRRRAQK